MQKFSEQKFLSLTKEQRHRKLSELLRKIYLCLGEGRSFSEELENYHLFTSWIGFSSLHTVTHKFVSDRYHQHLALAKRHLKEQNLLPIISQCDKAFASSPPLPIAIYLDNLRSAYNVGSIIRTTEALSLGKLYFSGTTPTPHHPQVQKTSMGTWEWVHWSEGKSIDSLPSPLIVMETSPDALSIYDFIFPERFTLALGNEEYGSSDAVLRKADHLISIPHSGRKNSLNVSNAFSMVAAAILGQRSNFSQEALCTK